MAQLSLQGRLLDQGCFLASDLKFNGGVIGVTLHRTLNLYLAYCKPFRWCTGFNGSDKNL